ncbi:MAG: glycosyltransferase family 2 protein [Gammaproteobacteria bacterium]|nr:glycosyltransferase family 2 protein [Gammaproteobacteria bacterium]
MSQTPLEPLATDAPLLSFVIPVYNDRGEVAHTVAALAAQKAASPFEVILVDDGSEPPLASHYSPPQGQPVFLLRLDKNQGRSGAINAGVARSAARYIALLDADCVPQPGFVDNLMQRLLHGERLVFGHIAFRADDAYFDRYENLVQLKRSRDLQNWDTSLTSANVALQRELFLAVDGFSSEYRHYGFEDRDFFIRLRSTYPDLRPLYLHECTVVHVDRPELAGMLDKFFRSGKHTAAVFRQRHPEAYQRMGQRYFDAALYPAYRVIPRRVMSALAAAGIGIVRQLFAVARHAGWYPAADNALKLMKGLAYLRGTLEQEP